MNGTSLNPSKGLPWNRGFAILMALMGFATLSPLVEEASFADSTTTPGASPSADSSASNAPMLAADPVEGANPGSNLGTAPAAAASTNPVSSADNQAVTPSSAASSSAPTATPNVVATPAPEPAGAVPPTADHGFQFSTLPIKFTLTSSGNYDDNIYIRNSNRVGDFYSKIIPGLEYKSREIDTDIDAMDTEPENYFHLAYKPEFDNFLNQTNNNFIDHHVVGNYLFTGAKLKLGLDAGYNTSHYPNIDFGGRLNATYYTARAYWEYDLSRRLTLGGDVTSVLSRYKQGIDSNEYASTAYLDYALFPKTSVGLGTTVGYLSFDDFQPHQDYIQFHGRVSYQIADKINLIGKAGVEYREYDSDNYSSTDPNFALAILYQPFDSTTLQLQAERRSVPSITQSLVNYNDDNVSVTWNQRFLQNFYFNLKATYEHDDYYSIITGSDTGLTYDYVTVRPSIEWDWNKYLKFSAYYEWENNHASVAGSGFYDNSVGLGVAFSY